MKRRLQLLALFVCALGCDSANPVAPTGTVLTVTASPTIIGLAGQASILTITGFKPDGNPLNPQTQVVLNTDLGVLRASGSGCAPGSAPVSTVQVDSSGVARADLCGDGQAGPATVTASLTTGGEGTASATVTIGQTTTTQPTLSITISPSVIGLNENARVTALARNSDGSLLGAGSQVQLRTDLGTLVGLSSSCDGSSATSISPTTGSDSQAEAKLCPGSRPGTATVTGSVGSSVEVTATVQFGESDATRPTVTVDANPSSINIGGQATIGVFARGADGSPLPDATVSLRTTLGTLGLMSLVTGSSGEAATFLRAGVQSGDAVVTGFVGSSAEASATVVIAQPVLTVTANPSTVDVEEPSTITVIARGSNGVPLGAGLTIQLTADLGTLDDSRPETDVDGVATAIYTAGDRAGTGRVSALLGTSEEASADIVVQDAPTDFSFEVSSETIPSGGGDIVLTATVVNARGDGLQNILVRFGTRGVGGSFSPGNAVLTDTLGVSQSTLTLTQNQLDSVQGGSFEVTATVTIDGVAVEKSRTITITGA